ncbi:MAG: preprotein translocase subunit SecA [Patescibacteria group bacterium]
MAIFDTLFGSSSTKKVRATTPLIKKINELENVFQALTDDELRAKTEEFKKILTAKSTKKKSNDGYASEEETENTSYEVTQATLKEILPEAFATVREASRRVLGMRHFDVQLIGAIILNNGSIAEMKTGEGKTLVSTLAIYLNALMGRGVHVVTVNDYLAKRDAEWMGKLYDFLGLSTGIIVHDNAYVVDYSEKQAPVIVADSSVDTEEATGEQQISVEMTNLRSVTRREAYAADITYGTNNEFGFDYLRDNMVHSLDQKVQRDLYYAVIDEIDSILIDEARTPLIISAPAEESGDMYRQFAQLVPSLVEHEDYIVDEKKRVASLTDAGIEKMERLLGLDNIYDKGVEIVHHLEQALKALVLFKRDKDYIARDGEVIIVDEFTGRLMPGRRYSEGLHQAIEAKEGVEIKRESVTLATITFQNYFRLYEKISGMTGTAMTESEEFYRIYKLDVVEVPTHRERKRSDGPDRIYKNEKGKFDALVADIKERNTKGQPVLVGTISIEKNEVLSHLLKINGVPHELLNAKQHEREAAIIAQAGAKGSVTIATNMAGRGVDIILGGHPYDQAKADEVRALGGLAVLGTERHESRRIDNQLRGRAGRQGDPGYSQFYISLEDDLMRIFGGERIQNMMTSLGIPDDQPIENGIVSRSIEAAQKKVEGHNFDIRKHVLEYDDVMNKQRATLYTKRNRILIGRDTVANHDVSLLDKAKDLVSVSYDMLSQEYAHIDEVNDTMYARLADQLASLGMMSPEEYLSEVKNISTPEAISAYIVTIKDKALGEHIEQGIVGVLSADQVTDLIRSLYLRIIDSYWVRHLTEIDHLRTGIGLVGYGQKDPLVEYKHRSYTMFQKLLALIDDQFVKSIMHLKIEKGN